MKIRSSRVVTIALLLLLTGSACTSPARRVWLPALADSSDLDALLQRHPLAASDNIRSVPVLSSEAMSTHLVQIRHAESPHRHVTHDLTVAMLRGKGTLHLQGEARAMLAGDVAVVPRGTVHFFVNEGAEPAVAFVAFAPPYDGKDQVPASTEGKDLKE